MNIRKTLQKQKIFDNLKARKDHPTIKEIYEDLKDDGIGIATIYRNLNNLADDGMIVKIIDNNQISHFDVVIDAHCHLICKDCGGIFDIPASYIFKENMDIKIDYDNVVLNGRCKKCLEKGQKQKWN